MGNRKRDGYEINRFVTGTIIYRAGLEVKYFVGNQGTIQQNDLL